MASALLRNRREDTQRREGPVKTERGLELLSSDKECPGLAGSSHQKPGRPTPAHSGIADCGPPHLADNAFLFSQATKFATLCEGSPGKPVQ